MHCPRCGTENEPGDRFCSNCGATLRQREKAAEDVPVRERIRRLIGTTRRSRLITLGTVLAVVIAIVAAFTLPSNDNGIPRDSYTIAADRICVDAKKQIGTAANGALADASSTSGGSAGEYARRLVPIVAQWRVDFNALGAPHDRIEQANALDAALREVETHASSFALDAQRGDPDLGARAQRLDQLTRGVERAVSGLNLDECAHIAIAPGAPAPG